MKKITFILLLAVTVTLFSSCYSSNKMAHRTSTFVQCSVDVVPVEMNRQGYRQAAVRQKHLHKQRKSLMRQKKRDMYVKK